jgi:ribose 5-phosphate isomerase B
MIYIGSDHGGFELKGKIKKFLDANKYKCMDMGNKTFEKEDDYPDYAFKVAEKVAKEKDALGILFCRSSGGMIIAANKVKNIRAVSVSDEKSARHAREHNDANVIALSGDWMDEAQAKKIVKTFLESKFSNEDRHVRRLKKISKYEND